MGFKFSVQERNDVKEWDISADRKYGILKTDADYLFINTLTSSVRRNSPAAKLDQSRAVTWAQFGPSGSSLIYLADGKVYFRRKIEKLETEKPLLLYNKPAIIPENIFYGKIYCFFIYYYINNYYFKSMSLRKHQVFGGVQTDQKSLSPLSRIVLYSVLNFRIQFDMTV